MASYPLTQKQLFSTIHSKKKKKNLTDNMTKKNLSQALLNTSLSPFLAHIHVHVYAKADLLL